MVMRAAFGYLVYVDEVLLVEGHRLLRGALRELLAHSGMNAVIEVADPVEAVQQTVGAAPRIIVLETTWLELKGIWLSRVLRAIAPQSKIVLLVDESWQRDADAARESGADAFVAKHALSEKLPPILAQWQTREQQPVLDKG